MPTDHNHFPAAWCATCRPDLAAEAAARLAAASYARATARTAR